MMIVYKSFIVFKKKKIFVCVQIEYASKTYSIITYSIITYSIIVYTYSKHKECLIFTIFYKIK